MSVLSLMCFDFSMCGSDIRSDDVNQASDLRLRLLTGVDTTLSIKPIICNYMYLTISKKTNFPLIQIIHTHTHTGKKTQLEQHSSQTVSPHLNKITDPCRGSMVREEWNSVTILT